MFKITIDNEEVITDKDFTIEEEMLNTPSVILNNVYPKEWETEKDYLNFYHPNEYSKCKIYDEEITPASEGSTVEGTDFSITYDDTKEFSLLSLKGNTSQTTTTGKNLLANDLATRTENGITITKNTDGTYKVNGTATADISLAINNNFIAMSGTWRMLGCPAGGSASTYMLSAYVGYWGGGAPNIDTGNGTNITYTGNVKVRFYIKSGTTCNNLIFKPMLTTDTSTTINNWERYTGGIASPNPSYPQEVQNVTGRQDIWVANKNLINIDLPYIKGKNNTGTWNNNVYTSTTGLTITMNEDNSFTINGTSTAQEVFYLKNQTMDYATGTYYLSGCQNGTGTTYDLRFYNATGNYAVIQNFNSYSQINITNNGQGYNIAIVVRANQTLNNIKFYPMLSKSTDTTYEKYIGTTYELNLGKNLFKFEGVEINGITATLSDEGIVLNGTSTGVATFQSTIPQIDFTHTLSFTSSGTNSGIFVRTRNSSGTLVDTLTLSSTNGKTTSSTICSKTEIRVNSGITLDNFIIKPQLEKGSQATEFAPYKTPIELCKIGNYQDYIFKNTPDSDYYDNTLEEGAWYLHKAINKVVLNGSENWDIFNNSFFATIDNNYLREQTTICISNYYRGANNVNGGAGAYNNGNNTIEFYYPSSLSRIYLRDDRYSNVNDYKTWLSSHNVSVYYVLDTPTTELLEDTELLGQLEEINLLNGLNNISVSSPYLLTPIKIHYNFNEEIINQDLYFCGVVKNSGNISLNPREPHFQSLQVLSYKTFLSEGETLDFVIYQKTIREAIEQVVSAIQDYGFIVGDINILNPDEIIGAYSTKDKSAYDVFQYIADITQSRWTTRMIDEDTIAIDFYDPSLMQLGTTLDYTQEFFEDNLIDDMSYSYGTNDYRNKQVMTSQEVYSNINQIQNIVANGYQTQFNTEQQIGKINSIKIGGVDYTFATNTEKDMGVIADFYYSAGNNYFESASTISIGTVIVIDYLPIVEGRQIITNSNEIDRVANSTGVKGVVARYENRNDATTSTELQLIGQSYIKYKGVPEIVLTIITRKNIWDVGQRVQFNAPINELATLYMVRKKAIHRITTIDTIFYTYELVSSFNSETAVNYFDNQRAKANGNIGEGEYISRNIDIQSTANIVFYDTQANEITIVGDNELNCTLESPFVS